MFKSIIDKIGTFLKVAFSWKRVHSPNSTSKAKTHQGHAGSTSGDYSPLHIGDVHLYYAKKETRETTSYTKSWETLLKTFSPESAQRFARMINDPKSKDPGKHNLNGHKKWLSQQFENIGLDHSDPRAPAFNQIKKKVITSIEELYDHGEESQFEKAWANHLFDLEAIKDI
jgi:hypothetical protein